MLHNCLPNLVIVTHNNSEANRNDRPNCRWNSSKSWNYSIKGLLFAKLVYETPTAAANRVRNNGLVSFCQLPIHFNAGKIFRRSTGVKRCFIVGITKIYWPSEMVLTRLLSFNVVLLCLVLLSVFHSMDSMFSSFLLVWDDNETTKQILVVYVSSEGF